MNINYSKLYSIQLDYMKDINIRSSWGLNYKKEKKKHGIEKINQGSKLGVDQAAKNILIKKDQAFKPK